MKHENVIKHLKFLDKAIVMEFAEYGDLKNFLIQQIQPIKWLLRIKWSMQLTNALVYLHKNGIVHRDLRCVNILVL
jgi:serine/threonine protein kinase